ncbi:MAG TPA: hypothetical protein VFK05_23285 [Polyangiaceae bacterium]|nr:hypothetical protein [Polyangiaceae bacterium]
MNQLVPCPECGRHVRVSETQCPFCALPLDLGGTPAPRSLRERLSRAATLAFGATFASTTALIDCSAAVPIYGAPAPSAGSANLAGASGSGAGSAGEAAGGASAGAAPTAGADNAASGGGPVPVYGAPAGGGFGAGNAGSGSGGAPK